MEFKKKTLETQIIEIFQKISPAITRLIQSTMNNDKIVLNLGKTKSKNKFIILSTIDNLIKGGSGQGIQNMNLKFGFPIKTGLT